MLQHHNLTLGIETTCAELLVSVLDLDEFSLLLLRIALKDEGFDALSLDSHIIIVDAKHGSSRSGQSSRRLGLSCFVCE